MKKLIISIATASLLISAGAAFSQTQNPVVQKDAPAKPAQAAPAQTQNAPASTQAAPAAPRTGASTRTGERREGERRGDTGERRGDRSERREGGERAGINIRIGGDHDGYRHRRGFRHAEYGARCRVTIVKSYRHGHRVIKRIRRCW
jgi:hypothetical protein